MTTSVRPSGYLQILRQFILSLFLLSGAAHAAPHTFNIPAQAAPSALQAFIKQSGAEVLYIEEELAPVRTNSISGDLEAEAALAGLLKDTGFVGRKGRGGKYVVARAEKDKPGSIDGSVQDSSGRPVTNASISVMGTSTVTMTDRRGRFYIAEVQPGVCSLLITGDGTQTTRVTDITVRNGRAYSLGPITLPVRSPGLIQMEDYVVSAKKIDGILELDPYQVSGQRARPYSDANVDLPRTMDDAKAYYIFSQAAIDQSGANDLEEFLRFQLPMETSSRTSSQLNAFANISTLRSSTTFSLRGLPSTQTLILINGRRVANVNQQGTEYQADLSGLPLAAIDRVEVLPSSASGIYGGGAMAGVINVILKRNYVGTEVKASYENDFATDSPKRTLSFTTGIGFDKGRTNLLLSVTESDTTVMRLQDRIDVLDVYLRRILTNAPSTYISSSSLWPGTTPNVYASSGIINAIGAVSTYVPAGYRGFALDGLAPLAANAGKLNLEYPRNAQPFSGLMGELGTPSRNRSFLMTLRRQMTPWLEVMVDGMYQDGTGHASMSSFTNFPVTVVATSPINPFRQNVVVTPLDYEALPMDSRNILRRMTVGFTMKLPRAWVMQGDYAWTGSGSFATVAGKDFNAFAAAVNTGVIDVFRDSPIDTTPYRQIQKIDGFGTVNDLSLRTAGSLWSLPWGAPQLAATVEHRREGRQDSHSYMVYPGGSSTERGNVYPGQQGLVTSAYVEATVPLITKANELRGVRMFDLQLSVRGETYTNKMTRTTTNVSNYAVPYTVEPVFFSKTADYDAVHPTYGFRYKPFGDVTLRGAYASAFQPPTYSQLTPGIRSASNTNILDRRRGNAATPLRLAGGGNPDIRPETSESVTGGLIWTPAFSPGFRLALDYTYLKKRDKIMNISGQLIVDNESIFPDRVIRGPVPANDSFGVGPIIDVDNSVLNLYKTELQAYDLSLNYRFPTRTLGTFTLSALATYEPHFQQQLALAAPLIEYAGFGGSVGPLKFKGFGTLTWEQRRWILGWTARYFCDYPQFGPPATTALTTIIAQGGLRVSSQIYHEIFARLRMPAFDGKGAGWRSMVDRALSQTDIQVTVRNILDRMPPFDANAQGTYYYSSFGDIRGVNYRIALKKSF